MTEVARESITATNTILSERNRSNISLQRSSRNQSIDLMKKGKTSTRSLPADAATTRLNIASTGSSPALSLCSSVLGSESLRNDTKHCRKNPVTEDKDLKKLVGKNDAEGRTTEEELHKPEQTLEPTVEVTPRAPIPELPKSDQLQDSSLNRSSGWFGWLSRNTGDGDGTLVPGGSEPPRKLSAEEGTENSSETEQNQQTDTGINTEPSVNAKQDICTDSTSTQISSAETPIPKVTSLTTSQRRTWLYLWSGNSTAPTEGNAQITELPGPDGQSTNESPAQSGCPLTQEESESGPTIETSTSATAVKEPVAKEVPKSTSWLFWSRESQGLNSDTGSGEVKEATEPLPENSQPILAPLADQTNAQAVQANGKARAKKTVKSGSTGSTKGVATQLSTPESLPEQIKLPSSGLGKQVGPPPNHVLPAFENTFPVQDRPGLFQQLGRLIYYGKGPEPKHVLRTQHRPLIKKALAIGIHGYFPAPLIRNIIGQPTGTSIKFATMAEQAILEWAAHHETPCQVEKIVLEGEGRISERVDLLWKLLLNWIDHLRSADFIMVSCHSQGVPVATMLVAKLIAFGCVTSARIGICAMAGVNLGPFPDYRSRWISGSAGELFDFADSNSKVSQDYMAALNSVLEYGVRITYLGSIDDQLVSLEV